MSKPRFKIVSYPDFQAVAPGAQVSILSELTNSSDEVPEGTTFQWICYNDPDTTAWYQPSMVYGPRTRHWEEARWTITGVHKVVLKVRYPDGRKEVYQKKQRVDKATNILTREFDPAANDLDPTPLQTLENTKQYLQVLKKIAAEKPPQSEKDLEKHQKTVELVEAYIFHLDDHLKGLEHREAFQVDAIHLDEERSTRTVLKLWLINRTTAGGEPTWRLVDWTNPAHRSTTGCYEGSGETHQEAIEDLIDEWDDNNRYPEGRIRYQFKVPKYGINLEDGFDTDGMSTWDEISKWLDYVALGAAVVAGVVTLIAPIPGSRVVSAAIWTSIATSTGAATINIVQRHSEGFGNAKDDLFDGLSIVGNMFAGAATYWKIGATVTSASRLGPNMSKAVIIGQIGTDGMQGILLATEHVGQYKQIMDDPNLLPDERLKKLMELFRSAAISGTLTYIAVKGSTADLNNLNNNRTILKAADVEVPETAIDLDAKIEQGTKVHAQQSEAKVKTQAERPTRQLDEGAGLAKSRLIKRLQNKFVNPDSFEEAEKILDAQRTVLEQGNYVHKYDLEEILEIVSDPKSKDRYVTRIMNTSYLDHYITKEKRGGYLGAPLEHKLVLNDDGSPKLDKDGKEVMEPLRGRVWSAGFDQTERGDKCPKQQAEMAGVNREVNPKTNEFDQQTLVLIDRVKYMELTESEMFRPTWDNMIDLSMRFVNKIEGTEPERLARIKAVMNDDYIETYASVFDKAKGLKLNLWKDAQRRHALIEVFGSDEAAQSTWMDRFMIQSALGANEHFLGTGYTKSLVLGSKQGDPGIAELFVVENKLMTIKELEDAKAIKVFDIITPVSKK